MMHHAQQVYKRNQVTTASPAELTMQLYNGAIRFLDQAIEAIEQENIETANERLVRVQDIVRELEMTLDTTIEIGQQLKQLYDYMLHRLTEANIKKDLEIVQEVCELLTDLRDAWKEVVKLSRQQAVVGAGLS